MQQCYKNGMNWQEEIDRTTSRIISKYDVLYPDCWGFDWYYPEWMVEVLFSSCTREVFVVVERYKLYNLWGIMSPEEILEFFSGVFIERFKELAVFDNNADLEILYEVRKQVEDKEEFKSKLLETFCGTDVLYKMEDKVVFKIHERFMKALNKAISNEEARKK